jgi:hypothetical protein
MNVNVLQQCLTIYLRQPQCRKIVLHDYHNKNTYKACGLPPDRREATGGRETWLALISSKGFERREDVAMDALTGRHPTDLARRAGSGWLAGAGSGSHLDRSTWPTLAEKLKKSEFCDSILHYNFVCNMVFL